VIKHQNGWRFSLAFTSISGKVAGLPVFDYPFWECTAQARRRPLMVGIVLAEDGRLRRVAFFWLASEITLRGEGPFPEAAPAPAVWLGRGGVLRTRW
jgi:hypothetical protein